MVAKLKHCNCNASLSCSKLEELVQFNQIIRACSQRFNQSEFQLQFARPDHRIEDGDTTTYCGVHLLFAPLLQNNEIAEEYARQFPGLIIFRD